MNERERQELTLRHIKGFLSSMNELKRIVANVEGHVQKLAALLEEEKESVRH